MARYWSLIYTRGNLRMTTQAEALADGEPGATIPVRNLQTKKQIYATVKDGAQWRYIRPSHRG